jgi:hypothetical protein
VVIDAVLQLPAAVVRHCTIVGDGPERAALEARAAGQPGRVRFTGAVPFDAVLAAYEDHDVLVLVSETEGFPKVVAEARAFGLHVLDVAAVAAGAPSNGALPDAAAVARSLLHLAATAARAQGAAEAATRPTLGALRDALDGLLRGLWDHQETGVGAG